MPAPILLLLALLATPPTPQQIRQGAWLPTMGSAGEQQVQSIARGGDGAIYAAGSGKVHRLELGGRWQLVGRYAPKLQWDGDQNIEATGPFPARMLVQVALDAESAIEATDIELGAENEDLIESILIDYVEELDADPDSPFSVAGMTAGEDGVWLGTGSGLFYAQKNRVTGPVGRLRGIRHMLGDSTGLTVATGHGVFVVSPTGRSRRWRNDRVKGLAHAAGRRHWIADAALWQETDGAPVRLRPPTGEARLITGHGEDLFVATQMAIYRYTEGAWSLCGRIPEGVQILRAVAGFVFGLTDETLYVADRRCERFERVTSPWPGGMRFTDVTWAGGAVWAASTEGVFLLGPPDPTAQTALDVAGFQRQARRVPRLGKIIDHAFAAGALDRETLRFGNRPLLRHLAPFVGVRVWSDARRYESDPTLVRGNGTLDTRPLADNFRYRVTLEWRIPLDILVALVDVDRVVVGEVGDSALDAALNQAEDSFESTDGTESFDRFDAASEASFDVTAVASQLASKSAILRRQTEQDRNRTFRTIKRLYRERMRLLFTLWVNHSTGKLAENDVYRSVLRLDEIDALLDVKTGGAYSRLMQ